MQEIELSNGKKMPIFGLGTWRSEPGEVKAAVEHSIDVGYRHLDCAWAYLNENEVGEALEVKFKEGKVKREDIFVTSKLWNSFHRPEEVPKGLKETMDNLRLDYIDLYLIHWPVAYKPGNIFPDEEAIPNEIEDSDLVATWKAMEALYDSGKVKSIGVSNFNIEQMQRILNNCRIKPVMNQIEVSVYLPNTELVEFCQKNGVAVTAYSSLGSLPDPDNKDAKHPLTDPVVMEVAKRHECTPAQVLISYCLNRNLVCIPKSVKAARIEENFKALNVKLSDEDMKELNNIKIRHRAVNPTFLKIHKEFPFE